MVIVSITIIFEDIFKVGEFSPGSVTIPMQKSLPPNKCSPYFFFMCGSSMLPKHTTKRYAIVPFTLPFIVLIKIVIINTA